MKRAMVVVAGIAVGIVVAGPAAAAIVPLLPARLQEGDALWSVAGLVIAASLAAAWKLSGRRRQ